MNAASTPKTSRPLEAVFNMKTTALTCCVMILAWFGAEVLTRLNDIDERVRIVEQIVSAQQATNELQRESAIRERTSMWDSIRALEEFAAEGDRVTPRDLDRLAGDIRRELTALRDHLVHRGPQP